jgi:hypothetical protein
VAKASVNPVPELLSDESVACCLSHKAGAQYYFTAIAEENAMIEKACPLAL